MDISREDNLGTAVARRAIRAAYALLLVLMAAGMAFAQSAAVSGRVVDQSGAIVSSAGVILTSESTGSALRSKSNPEGLFVFPFLPSGRYTLTVTAPAFKRFEKTRLTVETGQTLAVDISLQIGDAAQTITVDGSAAYINTVDASVSTVVDRRFVENLPLNGRTLQSLMTMAPGVAIAPSSGIGYSGDITVNGQRTEANYFTVDGVSANVNTGAIFNPPYGSGYSGTTAGQTALGTTQTMVSLDALQEFRVATSTYSAEYGRTPGGQFSFTTRSGTNELHGSLFDYFRNDALDANDFFSNRVGVARQVKRQNDFGGTMGGPLLIPGVYNGRSKSFFFASYEGLRLRVPQPAADIEVPTLQLRQSAPVALQPFLNAWPVPTGPDRGNGFALFTSAYSNPGGLDAASVRLDHTIAGSFKVFGRYNYSPSDSGRRIAATPATRVSSEVTAKSLTAGATGLFSPRLSNDLRFNITSTDSWSRYSDDTFGGAIPVSLSSIAGLADPSSYLRFGLDIGASRAFFYMPKNTFQRQINLIDTISAVFGAHTLKFGLDYRRLGNEVAYPPFHIRASFTSLASVMANKTNSLAVYKGSGLSIKPVYTNLSMFAQDEWRATARLSLSLGLRWEVNPAPGDADGNPPYTVTSTGLASLQTAPRGTPLWRTTYGNFAPRFGLAYQLRQAQGWETVLRAGSGLFYDLGMAEASSGYDGVGASTLVDFAGSAFPLTREQLDSIRQASAAPPYSNTVFGFDPALQLPRTWQWSFSLEQAFSGKQTLTVAYLGSAGRKLLMRRAYYPGRLGNRNFASEGQLLLTSNGARSDYHALQLQFRRRLSDGLQVVASYTWSHAIDDASSNFTINKLLRASADFDLRHNAQGALTYEIPGRYSHRVLAMLLQNWSVDGRFSARSGAPIDILGSTAIDPGTGTQISYQPNLIPDRPLYVNEVNAPGGRRINFNAFAPAPAGVQGNAGRNLARGFSAVQTDVSIRREFLLGERLRLQLRAEAFNLLNNPAFGAIYSQLSLGADRFGYAYNMQSTQLGGLNQLYQVGGPRSIQLALKLRF